MTEKTLTTENIKPALDALRGELAPWPVVAMKQDRLNTAQLNAANSGITSSLVAQIIANTAAIRALESAITGTGLRALVVASLPAIGTQGILYIVPVTTYDPATDADVVNYSNEYIWIVAPDAPVTEGYYEQVGQTGIVINNGQLNITVNGTSVGTFTANQSGDTTVAITVPTNADYVDKTTAQSIAGVKTFSDGIVSNVTGNVTGDLTGTASKAIADEDGTSIKTGYGKLANVNTWATAQVFLKELRFNNTSYVSGTPSENIFYTTLQWGGYVNNTWSAPFTINNAVRTNGYNDTSFRTYSQTSNTLTGFVHETNADASDIAFRPVVNGTHKLGSSSYQWSSVYAQSYYYNGTAWGLDQANVWTGNNTFNGIKSTGVVRVEKSTGDTEIEIVNGEVDATTNTLSRQDDIRFYDKNTKITGGLRLTYTTDAGTKIELYARSWKADGTASYNRSMTIYTNGQTGEYYTTLETNFNPKTTGVYSLGSSTNRWSSVYADSYYYGTTAWGLDKANEWTGSNVFKSPSTNLALQSTTSELGSLTAASNWFRWIDKNGAQNAYISRDVWSDGADSLRIAIIGKRTSGAPSTSGTEIDCGVRLNLEANGTKSFTPFDNNINLGSSTNKWKSLNGVNPGALSLPDASNAVALDITNVSMDGTYTYLSVSVNGWLYVALKDTTCKTDGELTFYIGDSGTSSAYAKWATNFVCSTDGYVRCFIPVLANSRIRIRVNPNGGSPTGLTMTIYPCLGNV